MLSLIIILSLVCGAVPAVSAASAMKTSDQGINLIKAFEGFQKYPQKDGTQWSIGYGSNIPESKVDQYNASGITEAQAVALMKEHLADHEKSVNTFIDTHKLTLNQQQFDALVSFTYNLGASWMANNGTFRSAVINGKKGNDFIFAMAQYGKVGATPVGGLIQRRLCEANLYLNGYYSSTAPANYKYVIYQSGMEGVVPTVAIQGYDSTLGAAIKSSVAGISGYRFMGWYTKEEGGDWITALGSKSAGTTKLYAHWQNGEGPRNDNGSIKGTAADYAGYAADGKDKNVYKTPGGEKSGTVKGDAKVTVSAEYIDSTGKKWGKISNGWIDVTGGLSGTPVYEKAGSAIDPMVVTVKIGGVNNRIGPGTNYAKNGTYTKGQQLTLTAIQKGGSYTWGKSEQGWIALQYTDYDTVKYQNSADAKKVTAIGTIIRADRVNVRAGAGTSHAKVGSYNRNDEVKISLRQKVGNITWGLTEKGWISLYYVKLTEVKPGEVEDMNMSTGSISGGTSGTPSNGNGTTVISSGKIYNCNTLRIRAAAGTSHAHVGDYAAGTYVDIYETTTVGSQIWGRTDKGWISLRYVKLDAPTTGEGVTGRIFKTNTVNVRSGAGTHFPKVGSLAKGTKVEIFEYVKVGNATWGRTTQGWVSLYYVNLDTPLSNLDKPVVDSAPAVTEPTVTKYDVTIANATHGKVTASAASAAEGDEVTLTITPDANYVLDTLSVKTASGTVVTVTNNKFTMPEANVTVTATFKVQYNVKIQTVTGGKVTANITACDAGKEIILTATPDEGYELESVSVINTATNAHADMESMNRFFMPAADVNVVATFKKSNSTAYAVKINDTTNGTVTANLTSAKKNADVTLTISPDANYVLDVLTVRDASNKEIERIDIPDLKDFTFKMPGSDATVTATFKRAKYEVAITNVTGGTVTIGKTGTYEKGETVSVTVAAAAEYNFKDLTVKAGSTVIETTKKDNTYTFTMPAADVTVKASFEKIKYDLTIAEATGGTVTAAEKAYAKGATVELTITPATGYSFAGVSGVVVKSGDTKIDVTKVSTKVYSFKMPNSAVTVETTFAKRDYNVTVNEMTRGTVEADKAKAGIGDVVTLTVKPNSAYVLGTLSVKNGTKEVEIQKKDASTYTFTMPAANVTVDATFDTRAVTVKTTLQNGTTTVGGVNVRLAVCYPNTTEYVPVGSAAKTNGSGSVGFAVPTNIPTGSKLRIELVDTEGFAYDAEASGLIRSATKGIGTNVVTENSQQSLEVTAAEEGALVGSFVVRVKAK